MALLHVEMAQCAHLETRYFLPSWSRSLMLTVVVRRMNPADDIFGSHKERSHTTLFNYSRELIIRIFSHPMQNEIKWRTRALDEENVE